jgi:hypothetical protein
LKEKVGISSAYRLLSCLGILINWKLNDNTLSVRSLLGLQFR